MILTAHIATGAAIGANFQNPWPVILLSVVCHHLADLLPHWDYKIKEIPPAKSFLKITADILIGFVLVIGSLLISGNWEIPKNFQSLFSGLNLNLMLGIFFSLLPDGLLLLSWIFPKKPLTFYAKYHSFLHTSLKLDAAKGFLPFLIYLAAVLILLI